MKAREELQFVGITPEENNRQIFDYLDKKFMEIKQFYQPKEPTEYITKKEVSDMLSIKATSVHNWTKKNILQSYRIGGRVLYKRVEVEESIIRLNR